MYMVRVTTTSTQERDAQRSGHAPIGHLPSAEGGGAPAALEVAPGGAPEAFGVVVF